MYSIDKLIAVAEAEIGYLEKASNSNLYDKTANAGKANYTKYGYEMHTLYPTVMDYPAPWCDAFVDWCFYKAFGVDGAKELLCDFDDYTVNSAQYFKNMDGWYTSSPKRGDIIFYKNSERICHTGIVYAVDDTYVYTIEGNTSGASGVVANGGGVCKKKYALDYIWIAGYGRPDYGDQWAEEDYNTWGKITATSLNIREEPSVDTKVVDSYELNSIVFLTNKTNNGWYKTNKGYISAKYVEVDYMINDTRDNTPKEWETDAITWALNKGILKGDENGDLKLHSNATKADILVFLYRNEQNR